MITTILSDFSYVLLFPKAADYKDTLNGLYRKIVQQEKYNFFDYYTLNEELLKFYTELRDDGKSINIFTAGRVQDDPQLRGKLSFFENIISAEDYGYSKADKTTYEQITKVLGRNASEILFIDDQIINVNAAQEAGLTALVYKDNEALFNSIRALL